MDDTPHFAGIDDRYDPYDPRNPMWADRFWGEYSPRNVPTSARSAAIRATDGSGQSS